QHSPSVLNRYGPVEFHVDGLGIPDSHGDTSRGGRNLNRIIAKDFAGLPDHFPFFFGIAVFTTLPVVWEHVPGQLSNVTFRGGDRLSAPVGPKLSLEFSKSPAAFAGRCLISGNHDALDPSEVV